MEGVERATMMYHLHILYHDMLNNNMLYHDMLYHLLQEAAVSQISESPPLRNAIQPQLLCEHCTKLLNC